MYKMLKCMLYESYGTTIDQTFLSFVLQRQDVGEGQPIALGALRSGGSSRDITHRNTSQLVPNLKNTTTKGAKAKCRLRGRLPNE
jgi:hypothetical protein